MTEPFDSIKFFEEAGFMRYEHGDWRWIHKGSEYALELGNREQTRDYLNHWALQEFPDGTAEDACVQKVWRFRNGRASKEASGA